MPHVASDLKSHGLGRLQQQAGKQGYTPKSQATTPFDSILDETTRPDPAPRTQRAADDNSPRAERGQRTKSADRPDRTDRPDRPEKADSKAKRSDADAPAESDSTADSTKTDSAVTKTETKTTDATSGDETSDQTATADDVSAADAIQLAGEAKPADTAIPAPVAVVIDPAAALAANTAQADTEDETKPETAAIAAPAATPTTIAKAAIADGSQPDALTAATPATAAAATPTTTPTATAADTAKVATATASQPDAATVDGGAEAAVAQAQPNALAALAGKGEKSDKADLKSDKKADADKKAASAQTTLKPTAALDPEAAQGANGEPAKDTGAHTRSEATANSHRGVNAETATAAATPDTAIASKTPDLTPPPGLTVQAPTHAAQAQATAATVAPTTILRPDNSEPAVPLAGVAFEITGKALSGRNQFDIRLDPPDLGRIHVRMDVDRDGNVITHMVADRTDTLDLLRKDTANLERALQDAGLKTSDNSLQFSLRDQQANQQQRNDGGDSAHVVVEDEQLAAIEPAQRNYARYNAPTGGLDIRV